MGVMGIMGIMSNVKQNGAAIHKGLYVGEFPFIETVREQSIELR